ncbi:Nucleolar MIF4G domain-containing protein 1 [Quillaja saponaria]|uniref:Nucleolar MIF4G domain-containing protein 1 n=1 Tax=Quillaja saponaria TaxID=32244 RepID=A0AAD7Q7P7_QUISA|nr:Nucleolar MIF4G domain-containing protein 1 [Quillaja saponaria]
MAQKHTGQKSRREKRKESRLAKNATKHQSWLHHQKSRIVNKTIGDSNSKNGSKLKDLINTNLKETEVMLPEVNNGKHQTSQECAVYKEIKAESEPLGKQDSLSKKMINEKRSSKRNSKKTKVEKVHEMGLADVSMVSKNDIELERKLTKKLKVKDGKLRGEDDGLNVLFDGMSSFLDFLGGKETFDDEKLPSKRSKKSSLTYKKEKLPQPMPETEVADDLLIRSPELIEGSNPRLEPDEHSAIQPLSNKKKKRKLLEQQEEGDMLNGNTIGTTKPWESTAAEVSLKESPVQVPVMKKNERYVAPHLRSRAGNEPEEYTQVRRRVRGLLNRLSESNIESVTGEMSTVFRSIARGVSSQMISEEILASCAGGPRGNEQYAAVFGAFVAGMACLVGIDFSAKLMASLAKCFEDEYQKQDNLSLRNLTLLLSYLCIFGVCSSDLIYDFLIMLSKRLTEDDVSTILTILQCCGMKIRSADPVAMKNFILSVQNRVNELKASPADGQDKINSKRMEFMLETICDIKNNKKRPKEDPAHHTRIKKWLQKSGVDHILIRGLKWNKLVDPDKKGLWWLSGDEASLTDKVEVVASRIDKDVLETQKMLQLAASQRMNTDSRRAIFCIIMSGEDYIDAFEKLLRLDLLGKQDRDIMRVLVECCLREKVFNKYYTVLASKLCEHDKNHKFTLQFCLWDHFKELESMDLLRSMHLAKFAAEMVASFTLSLAVLKTVELNDIRQLTPKRIMHFRMLFEAILEYPERLVWNIFTRVAVTPELEILRQGIEFFIKEYVVKTNKALTQKFKLAKKALNNAGGVLL